MGSSYAPTCEDLLQDFILPVPIGPSHTRVPADLRSGLATLLEESLSCGYSLEGGMVFRSFKVSIIGGSPLSSFANTFAQLSPQLPWTLRPYLMS